MLVTLLHSSMNDRDVCQQKVDKHDAMMHDVWQNAAKPGKYFRRRQNLANIEQVLKIFEKLYKELAN